MKRIVYFILVFVLLIGGVSCGSNGSEKPAYDALSDNEKIVFDALVVAAINDSHSPSSVRVLEASEFDNLSGVRKIYLKLQGTNKFGGTVTYTIGLYVEEGKDNKGKRIRLGDYFTSEAKHYLWEYVDYEDVIDCSKINKALNEYWKEQGIN